MKKSVKILALAMALVLVAADNSDYFVEWDEHTHDELGDLELGSAVDF